MKEGDIINIEGEDWKIVKNPYYPQATIKWKLEN